MTAAERLPIVMTSTRVKRKRHKPDITHSREWRERQVNRLLGFEVLQKAIRGSSAKLTAHALADLTASDYLEAGRVFNRKFLPRLLERLGRTPTPENLEAIRKFFNESKY